MAARLLLTFLLALAVGCTARGGGDDDDAGDDDDSVDLPTIPDPGDAMDDWGNDEWDDGSDPCCVTPETAYPVGTVTMDAGYIQGVFDSSLQFFYVFRADTGLSEFTFPMYFEEVHLHDGAGLLFGDEIQPSTSEKFSVTWPVEAGGIYVVEVRSDYEGFF
jgi:hypothetical protein